MSVCLCNYTADVVLELASQKKIELEPASPDPATFSADHAAIDLLEEFSDQLPKPHNLMVSQPGRRGRSSEVSYHVWNGALPQNSFFAIDTGVYVTSPELTLLHQARQLHQVQLCQMLGRYLGTWTPASNEKLGQLERAPLTSFDSLKAFLGRIGRERGKGNLRLAMAYTCEKAASAPETALQLMLTLPPELYGFGLPLPIMNYKVDLSARGRRLCSRESIRIDLCWRDYKFGLEYQGEEHKEQLGSDIARGYAAREKGYELWYLAKEQLSSAVQMDFIAREVAARIDFPVDELPCPTEDELQELIEVLSGARYPKPLSYDELRRRRKAMKARRK